MTKKKKIILGVGLAGLGTLGFFYWKLRREEAEDQGPQFVQTQIPAHRLTMDHRIQLMPEGLIQRPWDK